MLRSLKLTTDCELPCLLMYAVAVQSLVLTSTSAPYQGEEVSENQEHCLKLEEFSVGRHTPPPPHRQILGGTPHKRTWSCTEEWTIEKRNRIVDGGFTALYTMVLPCIRRKEMQNWSQMVRWWIKARLNDDASHTISLQYQTLVIIDPHYHKRSNQQCYYHV